MDFFINVIWFILFQVVGVGSIALLTSLLDDENKPQVIGDT